MWDSWNELEGVEGTKWLAAESTSQSKLEGKAVTQWLVTEWGSRNKLEGVAVIQWLATELALRNRLHQLNVKNTLYTCSTIMDVTAVSAAQTSGLDNRIIRAFYYCTCVVQN